MKKQIKLSSLSKETQAAIRRELVESKDKYNLVEKLNEQLDQVEKRNTSEPLKFDTTSRQRLYKQLIDTLEAFTEDFAKELKISKIDSCKRLGQEDDVCFEVTFETNTKDPKEQYKIMHSIAWWKKPNDFSIRHFTIQEGLPLVFQLYIRSVSPYANKQRQSPKQLYKLTHPAVTLLVKEAAENTCDFMSEHFDALFNINPSRVSLSAETLLDTLEIIEEDLSSLSFQILRIDTSDDYDFDEINTHPYTAKVEDCLQDEPYNTLEIILNKDITPELSKLLDGIEGENVVSVIANTGDDVVRVLFYTECIDYKATNKELKREYSR